jgi:mannose-6-phosphate isomerase-like protein (cupin superfamily)
MEIKMKRVVFILFLSLVACVRAADAPGVMFWSSETLQGMAAKLAPQMNAQKSASEPLAKFATHTLTMFHREGSGEAEIHEGWADVFVVESGEATLLVGGTVVSPRNTGPGETRGTGVQGGETKKLKAGDILHIPAGVPHQTLLDPGKKFTYLVLKVAAK